MSTLATPHPDEVGRPFDLWQGATAYAMGIGGKIRAEFKEVKSHELDAHASDSSLRYMPGLDIVRSLAILMVLFYHGLSDPLLTPALYHGALRHALGTFAGLGLYGVHLFFVLSGFLISGILLDSRGSGDYYRRFYMRRALRILPAGLLMLAVLKTGHWISWRYFLAALLYLANMPRIFGTTGEYGPLWSLAVEEQFYLFWPFIVKIFSRQTLAMICVSILLLTPALRFLLIGGSGDWNQVQHKTWAVCDFFAAGTLLAIGVRSPGRIDLLRTAFPWLIGAGALLIAALNLLSVPHNRFAFRLLMAGWLEPWILVCAGLVIAGFLHPSIANGLLASPFVFIAKISYGLYLCHEFIFQLVNRHWSILADGSFRSMQMLALRFAVELTLAIAIATISRWTLEEFFLRLKPRSLHGVA